MQDNTVDEIREALDLPDLPLVEHYQDIAESEFTESYPPETLSKMEIHYVIERINITNNGFHNGFEMLYSSKFFEDNFISTMKRREQEAQAYLMENKDKKKC